MPVPTQVRTSLLVFRTIIAPFWVDTVSPECGLSHTPLNYRLSTRVKVIIAFEHRRGLRLELKAKLDNIRPMTAASAEDMYKMCRVFLLAPWQECSPKSDQERHKTLPRS